MKIKNYLLFGFFSVILCCSNQYKTNYSFFVAGHTYGKPGRTEFGLYPEFKNKFKFINDDKNIKLGFLTGDIVRHASKKSWDAVDDDLSKLNPKIYFSRGNHDGGLSFFEKRYGKSYKSFIQGQDLHIILDSNLGEWNITGIQLDFLKTSISDLDNVNNIFIYVHHIIWWNKNEFYAPYMNSRDRMSDNLTFWTEIAPLLKETKKPVYIFAGDVGAFDHKNPKYQSFSYVKKENIHLITSGMGGGKKDNFIIVDVLNNCNVKFRLIPLNGDDNNELGKLEDYKQIIRE